ncbi:hypothetical protein [Plantactinospora sp. B5E13]|uniref:hypothetical protein n=1 Tax=unclassified Plantactinospora TaxID=2631981 RepID=UPI00325C800C
MLRRHRLLATAGVAVLAAGLTSVGSPAAAATPGCAGYELTHTGHLFEGHPAIPWSYFFAFGPGPVEVCLDGPDGAEVDLILWRFIENGPEVVTSPTPGADKTLTYAGPGLSAYRVTAVANRGSGTYTIGVNTP